MDESIRSLTSLAPFDYVDVVSVEAPGAREHSPEEWARATVEGANQLGRDLAWRLALRFRLEPEPSPEHVGGWRIVQRSDTFIVLETSSRLMTAQIGFSVDPDEVFFATFIRYDQPVAGRLWSVLAVVHRAVAPGFLASGAQRVRQHSAAVGR